MKPLKSNKKWDLLSAYSFWLLFFTFSLKFSLRSLHPLTRNTFHSSPMPSIWISNTNKSHLFWFVLALPCCEREVGGTGQRILEVLSQNIDGREPVPMTLQPATHVNVPQVTSLQHRRFYLCRQKVDWAFISCCFSAPPRVLHRHSRKVKDNHSSLLLHTKQLLLTPWELRVLLKDMLMTIHEGFSLLCPFLVTCYCHITLNQHLTLQVGRWPYALLLLVDPLVAYRHPIKIMA